MNFGPFFKSLMFILLLAFAVWSPVFYFNVIVDPYGVFFKSDIHHHSTANRRVIKIKYLLKHKDRYDSFIFGSSRVNYFDPGNFPDGKFYNMTYHGGVAHEHLEDIKYLLQNDLKIKNLVVFIDYMSLFEPYGNPQQLGRKKYPETFREKVDFYKTYLLNKPDRNLIDEIFGKKQLVWRSYFEKGIVISQGESVLDANVERHLLKSSFHQPFSNYKINNDYSKNLMVMSEMVEIARQNSIELTIVLNPIHYVTFLNVNLDTYYEAVKALSEISNFYDFSGINPVTLNNYYYFEPSHYTTRTSNLVINRIYGICDSLPSGTFGVFVTKENIDEHIANHRKNLKRYFDATNLKNHYHVPVDLAALQPGRLEKRVAIKTVNNMPVDADTTFSAAPMLTVWGMASQEVDLSGIYLQISDKLFAVEEANDLAEYCMDYKGTQKEWVCYIPGHQIGAGVHRMRAILVEKNFYDTTLAQPLKVYGPKKTFVQFDALKQLHDEAELEIHYASKWVNSSSQQHLSYQGTAIDKTNQKPVGGIIAEIGDYAFESQLVSPHKQDNQGSLPQLGWGFGLPADILKGGNNEIVFTALHPDRKSRYATQKIVEVKVFSIDTLDYLKNLIPLKQTTLYAIDYVNEHLVSQTSQPIPITGNRIEIRGWAVDLINKGPASMVVAVIDRKQFAAGCDFQRPDVAKVFRNESYTNSGWRIDITTHTISKGLHEITFKVITGDKSSYYEIPVKLKVEIK